jgi:uncharacterized Fe-S cluster protein YjdI
VTRRLQVYETDQVRVTFDPGRCMHSGVCLRALPAVFDIRRRRWIDPKQADPEAVMAAVAKCPSGALQSALVTAVHPAVPRGDATAAAAVPYVVPTGEVTITVQRNGPLVVEGSFTLVGDDGRAIKAARRCELCRCGRSRSRPFCDNSHEQGPWE